MTKEQYFKKVKEEAEASYPEGYFAPWDDPEWQNLLGKMYERFSKMTPEEQQKLIKSAGPEEPFWNRAVNDGVYAYTMW